MDSKISELRQDLVSGDWVVVATGRAKRPQAFLQEREKFEQPLDQCPFEDPQESGHDDPVLIFGEKTNWSLQVVRNKFPAFTPKETLNERKEGPYNLMDGIGFHEIVITRDHKKHAALLEENKVQETINAYKSRYLSLASEDFVSYISVFHNYGKEAGASISHPHSQIIASPVTDPDVKKSLDGSLIYFGREKHCVHCTMIDWELKSRIRVVEENDDFVAFCPFASVAAFEIRIFPKEHSPYFEEIDDKKIKNLASILKSSLFRLYIKLNDPAYNFFLHTSPCGEGNYDFYHWHFEIIPKTSIWAGFELGAGIEISTIEPEKVAEFLKD